MKQYEYKAVAVKSTRFGILFPSPNIQDLEEVLNREAKDGWRFRQAIPPSVAKLRETILVLEREVV
ncbi:MAG: DUF4177 domain-containing protein [Nitrospinae bacterium]|nr:DUF4177 domain-containing protein [Nitrospinota bacterium]